MTRITPNFLNWRSLYNLQRTMANLEKPQREITTGKRINKPSDDPVDAARLVDIKEKFSKNTQYGKNISSAFDWMTATSSALENIVTILDDVDELISTLGDPTTSAERQNAKCEVDVLLADLLSAANRKFVGKYLFGGNETMDTPFTASYTDDVITSVDQNPDGIDGEREFRMSDVDTITVNIPGDRVFQPNGAGADDDVFKILTDLRTALENSDSVEMKAIQERLGDSVKDVASVNAGLGGTIRRLNYLQTRLDEDTLLTDAHRSRLEDADIAKAMFEYNQAEITFQAALEVTARILQTSLMNFIR